MPAARATAAPKHWSFAAAVRSKLRDRELEIAPSEGAHELRISEQLAALGPASSHHSGAILMPPRAAILGGQTTGSFSKGGALVGEALTVEDVIRPETALGRLGARRVELGLGYGGKRSITPSRVSVGWVDYDNQEVAESRTIQFGSSTASPRECSVVVDVTRAFLRDATEAESMLQNVLSEATGSEAERVQLQGSGNGTEPWGIMRAADAGAIATTTGTPLYYATLLEALQGRVNAGARLRKCGWLFSAEDFGWISYLQRDSGGAPALESGHAPAGAWSLAGLPVEFSPWLESGEAVVGEFSQMETIFQGSPQMLVNPYTRAAQQITQISVFDTYDCAIARPSLLAVIRP